MKKFSQTLILVCITVFGANAQQKYTINFTPSHLTVNEDTDSIHITATIRPVATTPVGIDLSVYIYSSPDGGFRFPAVATLGFEPGDSVASILLKIVDNDTGKNIKVSQFDLIDFMHSFIMGTDSIFTLTVVDNDSNQDARIKSLTSSSDDASIKIFPNPATSGTINVSIPNALSGKLKIELMDMEGRVLKAYNTDSGPDRFFPITMPENAKGLMLLRFENEKDIAYKRIVIE